MIKNGVTQMTEKMKAFWFMLIGMLLIGTFVFAGIGIFIFKKGIDLL